MHQFNHIFQLNISSNDHLISESFAELCSPNSSLNKQCFVIVNEKELDFLEMNFTCLFQENYFSFNGKPVVLFQDTMLLIEFEKRIENFCFNRFHKQLINESSSFLFFINEKNDFNQIWKSNTSEAKYYVAKNNTVFDNWLIELLPQKKETIEQQYKLELKVRQLNSLNYRLKEELSLCKDSLLAVKTEYSKELDWYKTEIENIKSWFSKEHGKTPSFITKIFKKFF